MNKKMKILISLSAATTEGIVRNRKDILGEVGREVAKVAKGSADFESVALELRDNRLLGQWLHDAGMSIVSALDRYVASYTIDDYGVEFNAETPACGKEDVAQAIADAGADFIGAMLTAKWLTIVAPDKAEVYAARASEILTKLTTIADERRRPLKYEL